MLPNTPAHPLIGGVKSEACETSSDAQARRKTFEGTHFGRAANELLSSKMNALSPILPNTPSKGVPAFEANNATCNTSAAVFPAAAAHPHANMFCLHSGPGVATCSGNTNLPRNLSVSANGVPKPQGSALHGYAMRASQREQLSWAAKGSGGASFPGNRSASEPKRAENGLRPAKDSPRKPVPASLNRTTVVGGRLSSSACSNLSRSNAGPGGDTTMDVEFLKQKYYEVYGETTNDICELYSFWMNKFGTVSGADNAEE